MFLCKFSLQQRDELSDALCIVKGPMMLANWRQPLLSKYLFHAGFFEAPCILRDGFEIQMFSKNRLLPHPLKFSLKEGAIEVAPRYPCPERVIQPRLEFVQDMGERFSVVNFSLPYARQLLAKF